MKKTVLILFGALYVTIIQVGARSSDRAAQSSGAPVTFSNQVVRIFQSNCQSCHHPGDIAPFSLMTYGEASRWAPLIKEVTASRYMPPWKPVEGCGVFQNPRGLTGDEIRTLAQWADAGAPEGNPTDLPPAIEFPNGWSLGEPDMVLSPDEDYLPDPNGKDVYRCFTMPTNVPQSKFVSAVDIRPGNRAIVHHVLLFLDTSGVSAQLDAADPGPGYTCFGGPGFSAAGGLGGWAPGAKVSLLPEGTGMQLPANARVVMQVHYHPNGKPNQDRTRLGIYFAKGPVQKIVRTLPLLNTTFVIPAGNPHYKVTQSFTIPRGIDAHAIGIAPHMHLLGREMEVTATYPDGTQHCMVRMNDWDFNWQGSYRYTSPVPLPGGTRLDLTAYYDNSSDNPRNPNSPPKPVRWGENTTDEMCIAFFSYTLDGENLAVDGELARKNRKVADFLRAVELDLTACGTMRVPIHAH